LPHEVGTIERLHTILYHAWIADTRPDGLGVSKQMSMGKVIRLFTADIGDRTRTNMLLTGQLVADRTMIIDKVGLYCSFSNKQFYTDFFRCARMTLNIGDKPMLIAPASYFASDDKQVAPETIKVEKLYDPPPFTHKYGYCGFIKMAGDRTKDKEAPRGIAVLPRMGFEVLFEFDDDNFVDAMQRIERGAEFASYAQIMVMLEGTGTRELL